MARPRDLPSHVPTWTVVSRGEKRGLGGLFLAFLSWGLLRVRNLARPRRVTAGRTPGPPLEVWSRGGGGRSGRGSDLGDVSGWSERPGLKWSLV